jgi:hypothetical protein
MTIINTYKNRNKNTYYMLLFYFLKEKTIQNKKLINNQNSFIILAHQLNPFFTSNFFIKIISK